MIPALVDWNHKQWFYIIIVKISQLSTSYVQIKIITMIILIQ